MRSALSTLIGLIIWCTPLHAEMLEIGAVNVIEKKIRQGKPDELTTIFAEKIPVEDLDAAVGRGFDYLKADVLPGRCVGLAKGESDVYTPVDRNRVAVADKHEYIEAVRDMEANESASGDAAGFSFTYKLVHLGGSAETTRSNYFNTVDSFAKLYSRFVTRKVERPGGVWGPDAIGTYADRKKTKFDLKRFVDVCGTHYVRAVYFGSVINQTIKFTLKDKQQSKTNKDSLTLGIGDIFGANYDHTDRESNIRSVASITMSDQSKGIIAKRAPDPRKDNGLMAMAAAGANPGGQGDNPVKPIGGLQAAINYAHNQFPIDVASSKPDESEALFIDVEPYYRLSQPQAGTIPKLSEELTSVLATQAGLYERLLSQISDITNAQSLSQQAYAEFYAGNQDQLTNLLTAANKIRSDYSVAIDNCYRLIAGYASEDKDSLCSAKLTDVLSPTTLETAKLKQK